MKITDSLKKKLKSLNYVIEHKKETYYLCKDYFATQNEKYCEYIALDGSTIEINYIPKNTEVKKFLNIKYVENKYSELQALKFYNNHVFMYGNI